MSFSFFLITEKGFHVSYLVTKWMEACKKAEEGYLEMKTLASAKQNRKAIPVI